MAVVGLVMAFFGFVLAAGSLGLTSSNAVRLAMVLAGIVVSLVGIMGPLNQAYMKNAIWKK
jgi:hypothetical protein